MAAPKKKREAPRRRHAVNYIIWAANGQPIPESVLRKLDASVQKVLDESRVRLILTTLKEEAHG